MMISTRSRSMGYNTTITTGWRSSTDGSGHLTQLQDGSCITTPMDSIVVHLREVPTAPENLRMQPMVSALLAPMDASPGVSGGRCALPFSGNTSSHCIYPPGAYVASPWVGADAQRAYRRTEVTPNLRGRPLLRNKKRSTRSGRRKRSKATRQNQNQRTRLDGVMWRTFPPVMR